MNFNFQAISCSWVAIHPRPLGIINFVGELGFGSFPTVFYKCLLKDLYSQGYTIIAHPIQYRCSCWSGAISLINDLYNNNVLSGISAEAKKKGYASEIYQPNFSFPKINNFWLGHGLGCQFILLLEIITNLTEDKYRLFLMTYLGKESTQIIKKNIELITTKKISILNQPSVLIFPKIIINSKLLNQLTEEEIFNLIKYSDLFNFIGMIVRQKQSKDKTVNYLEQNVPQDSYQLICEKITCTHFAPLSFSFYQPQIGKSVIKVLKRLEQRLHTIN